METVTRAGRVLKERENNNLILHFYKRQTFRNTFEITTLETKIVCDGSLS